MNRTNIICQFVDTQRLRTFIREKPGTRPVLFLHGNCSSSSYWQEVLEMLPDEFRGIAPDLRGYGETETKPIDATRGLRDWSDDLQSLVEACNITTKFDVVGWSLGGGVALQLLKDVAPQVRSVTLLCPVSPFGFGGTRDADGQLCWPDAAGSGGGMINPNFVEGIRKRDESDSSPNSMRNVINNYYFHEGFRSSREDELVREALKQRLGDGFYPGNSSASPNWPLFGPGNDGPMNALSPKHCNLSDIHQLPHKPPILWVRGEHDKIVSDESLFELGTLGKLGIIPGWNADQFPPQPMVTQTRTVLSRYAQAGGRTAEVVIANAGHAAHIQRPEDFMRVILDHFLSEHEHEQGHDHVFGIRRGWGEHGHTACSRYNATTTTKISS